MNKIRHKWEFKDLRGSSACTPRSPCFWYSRIFLAMGSGTRATSKARASSPWATVCPLAMVRANCTKLATCSPISDRWSVGQGREIVVISPWCDVWPCGQQRSGMAAPGGRPVWRGCAGGRACVLWEIPAPSGQWQEMVCGYMAADIAVGQHGTDHISSQLPYWDTEATDGGNTWGDDRAIWRTSI